jgi:membrane associated rhomboid family serine protease
LGALGHVRILDASPVEASRASSTVLAAMIFLDKLERRIGFIAIPGLIRVVVMFTALVCILAYIDQSFISVLELKPQLIKQGQVWRLFTYIFIPTSPLQGGSLLSPLWAVVALWFLWFIGDGLERAWGPFRLTLYFFTGMLGVTIAAFLLRAQFSSGMLAVSLFLAFAWFYPNEIIYVMFILPVKIKWLAWITGAFLLFGFVVGSNANRLAMILAFSNYFLFFGPQAFQNVRQRKEVASRRQRFEVQTRSDDEPLHRCATCGATELSDPSLEFRVARDGEEYCVPHLPSAANAPVSRP